MKSRHRSRCSHHCPAAAYLQRNLLYRSSPEFEPCTLDSDQGHDIRRTALHGYIAGKWSNIARVSVWNGLQANATQDAFRSGVSREAPLVAGDCAVAVSVRFGNSASGECITCRKRCHSE
jgi:hypothetical protein